MPSYSKYLAYFKRVVTTPKADRLLFEENTYTFDVDMRLSKPMIKRLFEDIFKVEVTRVNTYNRHKPDKQGKSFYDIWLKRAYITVAEGQYPFQKLSNSDAQLAPIGVEDDE